MTAVEIPVEKWAGRVREVTLGASDGRWDACQHRYRGRRDHPALSPLRGRDPSPAGRRRRGPGLDPNDWSAELLEAWGDVVNDPVAWAQKAVERGADLIALKLAQRHPDGQTHSPEDAVRRSRRAGRRAACR